jgi:hypothetical protein
MSESTELQRTPPAERVVLDAAVAWAKLVRAEDALERRVIASDRAGRAIGRDAALAHARQLHSLRSQHALASTQRLEAEGTLLAAADALILPGVERGGAA